MDMMRTFVSALAIHDPDVHESTREANLRKGLRLTAQLPTIVTAHERLRKGKEPVAPAVGVPPLVRAHRRARRPPAGVGDGLSLRPAAGGSLLLRLMRG